MKVRKIRHIDIFGMNSNLQIFWGEKKGVEKYKDINL
jgi:hypothetical protein